jgi:hypothetical protein
VLLPHLDFLRLPPAAPEGSTFAFFFSSASASRASAARWGALISKNAKTRLLWVPPQPGLKKSPLLRSFCPNGFDRKHFYGDGINTCAQYAKDT